MWATTTTFGSGIGDAAPPIERPCSHEVGRSLPSSDSVGIEAFDLTVTLNPYAAVTHSNHINALREGKSGGGFVGPGIDAHQRASIGARDCPDRLGSGGCG